MRLTGQKRLKDYKNPDALPKVNKANVTGMIEAIKKYLRSCHDVMRVPLAYVIRKTVEIQMYGSYPCM